MTELKLKLTSHSWQLEREVGQDANSRMLKGLENEYKIYFDVLCHCEVIWLTIINEFKMATEKVLVIFNNKS